MKNILIVAVASLVLFGASAGVSVWLQSSVKTPDTAHADDKKKKDKDEHGDKGHADDKEKPHADAKEPADGHKAEPKKDAGDYRRLQMEVVAADVGAQIQEYDRLVKEVGQAMKELAGKKAELDAQADGVKQAEAKASKTAADLKKTRGEMDADERANVVKLAAVLDQMPAEAAAATVQQLADTGKTDLAVKIVAQMKGRPAAKMLAAITDTSLPPVLLDRMKALKPAGTEAKD